MKMERVKIIMNPEKKGNSILDQAELGKWSTAEVRSFHKVTMDINIMAILSFLWAIIFSGEE